MEHEEFRDLLDELRDAELAEPRKGELLAHLAQCPSCRQDFDRRSALYKQVFAPIPLPSAAQTESFTRAVMAKIMAQPSPFVAVQPEASAGFGRNFLWWAIPSLSFALAAFILALRSGAPSLMAPADSQLLIGAHNHMVAKMVLPPDPDSSRDLVAFEEEE